jgi:ElaB/YqjD/DUF883 family membrane-anchored ribosome-binding protein
MTQTPYDAGQHEGIAGQASEKMQDAASVAQDKTVELREQGSARLREQFDRRSTEAGTQARSLAEALRRTGGDLETQGKGGAARLSRQAADRIDSVGGYLEHKSGDEVMRDVESFARRRPWMLAGIGMLAGIAGARFMKASSERRYGASTQSTTQWPDVQVARTEQPLARDPYAGTIG